jgi:nucleotide-binding universal stress UspA family protein
MSETRQPLVVTIADGSDSARGAAQWAERFACETGAQLIETPPYASSAVVLDIASKREADFLVSGLRCGAKTADVDDELAALMRRCPCPLWTIQPWASGAAIRFDIAVVGVDPSAEARAAAHCAAALLRQSDSVRQLILVHGTPAHPSEMAAAQPWREIVDSMQLERHPWLSRLASELAEPGMLVDPIVRPVFAPELIGGLARCRGANFIALGSSWRSEGVAVQTSWLVRQVVRSTPCPTLVV